MPKLEVEVPESLHRRFAECAKKAGKRRPSFALDLLADGIERAEKAHAEEGAATDAKPG